MACEHDPRIDHRGLRVGFEDLPHRRLPKFHRLFLGWSVTSFLQFRLHGDLRGAFSVYDFLHLQVIAEFVETVEEKELLHQMGCDQYQGYLYSPAVPLKEDKPVMDAAKSVA